MKVKGVYPKQVNT